MGIALTMQILQSHLERYWGLGVSMFDRRRALRVGSCPPMILSLSMWFPCRTKGLLGKNRLYRAEKSNVNSKCSEIGMSEKIMGEIITPMNS